jgi:hypothetical protein
MPPRKNDAEKQEPEVVIFARYVGDGTQFFIDVPARDLTREEFNDLSPFGQRDVLASEIYEVGQARNLPVAIVPAEDVTPENEEVTNEEGENN